MLLDLTDFRVDEPPETDLYKEQRSHNECALKRFLLDAASGAYPVYAHAEFAADRLHGEQRFTAHQLFTHLKKYMADTGAQSNIPTRLHRHNPFTSTQLNIYCANLVGVAPVLSTTQSQVERALVQRLSEVRLWGG